MDTKALRKVSLPVLCVNIDMQHPEFRFAVAELFSWSFRER